MEEVTLEDVQKFFEELGYRWDFEYSDDLEKISRSRIKYKIAQSFKEIDKQLKEYSIVPIDGNPMFPKAWYCRISRYEFLHCTRPGGYWAGSMLYKDYSEEWNKFLNNKNTTLKV